MKAPIPFPKPIYITRPTLPDLNEMQHKLREIWDLGIVTNMGPQHDAFENKLKQFLKVKNISLFCNGTLALQLGCQTLRLSGEVITSPFTFPATIHVLYWNRIQPVFCDINPQTFNMDPDCIEALITPDTTAIMPVHVFGYPCDTDRIQKIADRHGLRVIYDAAHAFGVEKNGVPIGNYGDVSMFSFHATKLFHTVEGGAVICRNPEWMNRIELMRNFGFNGIDQFDGVGINGKNSELHAAMGLLNLKYMEDILEKVKALTDSYMELLKDCPVSWIREQPDSSWNRAYMPVIFKDETVMGDVRKALESQGIGTRRYFYPNLATLNYVDSNQSELPVTEDIVKRVLCLPLYFDLTEETQLKIATIIKSMIK